MLAAIITLKSGLSSASARSRPFTPAFSRLLLSVTSSGITASGNTLPEKATRGCTSW
ncbi:hypothetical protein D9M71_656030 [compost metagenome]